MLLSGVQTLGSPLDVFNDFGDKRAVRAGGFLIRHDAHARTDKLFGNVGVRHKTCCLKFEIGNRLRTLQKFFQPGGALSDETENRFRFFRNDKTDGIKSRSEERFSRNDETDIV